MRDYRKELQDFIDGKKDDALTLPRNKRSS